MRGRTARWADDFKRRRPRVHRFELFNRHDVFAGVADARLPNVATGDFHRLEHLATWKTLLPCPKDEEFVLAYLRSSLPTYLVRLDHLPEPERIAA